ncbi:hypothetical protein OC846_000988 [Tilletia horrida]|uniref:Uncharacterized protein n=1 Tax=Tilletia horrida TaxID=155126 RepID=A0AAN6GW07_9BASI|nr:hypothetical protein OC846_000988 [Tilletia horrida]
MLNAEARDSEDSQEDAIPASQPMPEAIVTQDDSPDDSILNDAQVNTPTENEIPAAPSAETVSAALRAAEQILSNASTGEEPAEHAETYENDDVDAVNHLLGSDHEGPKLMTDAQQHDVWYNLGNAQSYSKQHFKLENTAEKRAKVVTRSLWRIIRSASEVAARSGTAMFIGWATLEPGKQKHKRVVFASENICDPGRPTLYNMTKQMHDTFKKETDAYREAARAEKASHASEKMAWQAERIALHARIQQLEAERHEQSSDHSSNALVLSTSQQG